MEILRDEGPQETTIVLDRGVFHVTVVKRRPGSIVTEMLQVLEQGIRAVEEQAPLMAVVDIRGTAFSPSGQEIRWGASRLRRLEEGGRIALLVANDFQFGLGRMFGLLSQESRFDVRPFRDPAAAANWAREA